MMEHPERQIRQEEIQRTEVADVPTPDAPKSGSFAKEWFWLAVFLCAPFLGKRQWLEWLIFVLMAIVCNLVFILGNVIVALGLRIRMTEIGLGFGAPVFKLRWGGISLRLNCFLIGAYVKYDDDGVGTPIPEARGGSIGSRPPRSFLNAAPWERILLSLSGNGAMFLLAIILLGAAAARSSFASTFRLVIPHGADSSDSIQAHLRGFFAIIGSGAWGRATGILACKLTALNSIPIPPTATGTAVGSLIEWITGRKVDPRIAAVIQIIGVIGLLGLFGYFGLALIRYLWRG